MEIHSLKVQLSEQDLIALALQALRKHEHVSDLRVQITPATVVVTGSYRMMMRLNFESHWTVTVQQGRLAVSLRDLKAGGFGAGMFKNILLQLLKSEAEKEEGVHIDGETIFVDPDRLLSKKGMTVQTNLSSVRCEMGLLILEAGR